ncbi:MAG: hypothetical protein AB1349_11995 [Elusimicrobiota bacterium]
MITKKYFYVILFLLFLSGFANAKTRNQVVSDAISLCTIQSWTATNNQYTFDEENGIIFISSFSTGVGYTLWPYVFGGKEEQSTTRSRILGATSPGGENKFNKTYSTEWLYDNGYNPAGHLAGIDCSGFVCRALGYISDILNTNTTVLANKSIQITSTDMKPGDLLIKPGVHVRVVTSTSPLIVAEAASPPGYALTTSASVGTYGVYSPFLIFSDFSPAKDTIINDATPDIKVKIKSGTNILANSIVLKIDGNSVSPTFSPSTDAKEILVSYTPTNPLSDGQHEVYIYAKNSLNLEDDTLHQFPLPMPLFSVVEIKTTFSKKCQPKQEYLDV